MILIGTGSEVQLAVAAAEQLAAEGIAARVVSMPCREWFDEQDQEYRDSVHPARGAGAGQRRGRRRPSAGATSSATPAGSSASSTTAPAPPAAMLFHEFGFTAETVVAAAQESLDRRQPATTAPDRIRPPAARRHPQTWRPIPGVTDQLTRTTPRTRPHDEGERS